VFLLKPWAQRPGKLLEYIFLEYDADGHAIRGMKQGIRIVNFGTNLYPSALGTGFSSKRDNTRRA
jgi:hypothetical protein